MTSVWVVVGRTGEYSDAHEWAFGYYATEVEADAAAGELERAFRVFLGGPEGPLSMCKDTEWLGYYQTVGTRILDKAQKAMESIDPEFSLDYTGTCYEVREIRPGPLPEIIKTAAMTAGAE